MRSLAKPAQIFPVGVHRERGYHLKKTIEEKRKFWLFPTTGSVYYRMHYNIEATIMSYDEY